MTALIEAETGAEAYVRLGRQIVKTGRRIRPRGLPCYEITDATVVIADARLAVPAGTGRAIRPGIGAAEYCQMLGGVSFLEQLDLVSGGRFTQYADDGRLHGAYGPRAWSQLQDVAQRLEEDPDTRQAVIVIGRGITQDATSGERDVPCTTCVQYRLRDGRLDATVTMRSSDWFLGIPYDWWVESRLQMTMAWALGVEAGTFTWQAGSQHVYERDENFTWKVAVDATALKNQPPAITLGPALPDLNDARKRIHGCQEYARGLVLGGAHPGARLGGGEFYQELLVIPPSPEPWVTCDWCRYVMQASEACNLGFRDPEDHSSGGCNGLTAWRHG
jgi:Thymidylate synthase